METSDEWKLHPSEGLLAGSNAKNYGLAEAWAVVARHFCYKSLVKKNFERGTTALIHPQIVALDAPGLTERAGSTPLFGLRDHCSHDLVGAVNSAQRAATVVATTG